jgi:hypothetical protein
MECLTDKLPFRSCKKRDRKCHKKVCNPLKALDQERNPVTELILNKAGSITLIDWMMLCVTGTTITIIGWRVSCNLRDVVFIRRCRAQRGRKSAHAAWGSRENSLITLLIAEIFVAVALTSIMVIAGIAA